MRQANFTAVRVIAAKDLRQRLRDRSLFIYGIVAPLVLAFIFSLLLSPLADGDRAIARIGLADGDGSTVSAGLRGALAGAEEGGGFRVLTGLQVSDSRSLLAAGEIDAVIIVPAGFGTAATVGAGGELSVLGRVDRPLAAQVATAIAEGFASRVHSTVLAVQAMEHEGSARIALPVLALQASVLPEPLTLQVSQTSPRQLDFVTYYAAGMAVFFVFFIVQVGVTGLLDEERGGTMRRLLAAPIARGAILGGKVVASTILGLLSMAVLAAASTMLMGARWGDPLGVAVLILAVVLAAAGIMSLVAGLALTPDAASNVQSVVAVTLGALGGTFFPLATGEGVLSLLTRLTPHFWFLEGVADLSAGGGLLSVLTEAWAILLFALMSGTAGWWLLRRRLTP